MIRVALVQHAAHAERARVWERIEHALDEAARNGAQLVLLPELPLGAYFCQSEDQAAFAQAEPVPGPTSERLGALAARHGLVIVGSVFERRAAGLYHNTAIVLETDGRLAGCYRKMHIPDDPGFYEKYYFTPGDLGFVPITTSVGRLGVLVCWDQWYPEAARLMALAGADMLLYPTAIGYDPRDPAEEQARQKAAWELVQRGHAVANGLPVLVANRCGHEPDPTGATAGIAFWGGSFICGPQGEWLARGEAEPTVLMATLDRAHTERVRQTWPFLRDRRIDAYSDLLKRFRD